jgi:hypothetical protein
MQTRRVPALCLAILLAAVAWPVNAQRNNNNQPKPTPEQYDIEQLYRGVDAVAAGTQPAPTDIPVTMVQHHMLMTQTGAVMVPYTLRIDRSKVTGPLLAYVRVVDKDAPNGTMPTPAAAPAAEAKGNDRNRNNRNQPPPAPVPAGPTFPVSLSQTIEVPADGIVQRAIELKPGRYEMFIALKEKSTSVPAIDPKAPPALPPLKGGLLRTDLTVPDLATGLGTSTVILANQVEPVTAPLTPAQQAASPYTIGGVLKIVPNLTGQFGKTSELVAVLWLYGVTSVGGKPDVTVEYSFHRKAGETDKYFNRTEPQAYNAQTSAPTFNLDAGHQVMAIQGLSLQSFPAGDYRMEIKVTDKPSGKSVTQNVNFTVLPV